MNTTELQKSVHPFLEGLSPDHLTAIAAYAMPVRFEPGETIFKTGDPADRFYLLKNGAVSLRTPEAGGGWTEIQCLRSGDVLGWSWLFEPRLWQFDAVATEPTDAIFFYGTWLQAECEKDPALGYEIMSRISRVVIDRLQASRTTFRRSSTYGEGSL